MFEVFNEKTLKEDVCSLYVENGSYKNSAVDVVHQ